MNKNNNAVILLHATSHALRAEKLIRKAGISCKLVPVPRQFSSDCGVCLRLEKENMDAAVKTLKDAQIDIGEVHDL